MQLTQKETELLKDLKEQEKLCVEKYNNYSNQAIDPQLKTLFSQIAEIEHHHLDSIMAIQNGETPTGVSSVKPNDSFTATYSIGDTQDKKNDCYLCSDLLATEKHASSLYDTCIFEFSQEALRQKLDTIQGEEHHHGKVLYDYMSKNNMYG